MPYADVIKYLKAIQEKRSLLEKDYLYTWEKIGRPNQKMPKGYWALWLILAGRGFGKTRTGAESIRQLVEEGVYKRIALVGASILQTRSIMVEGVSGLLSVFPPHQRPRLEMTKRELHFQNGAIATLFGGEQVDQLRGPQFDAAWVDELAKFRHPQKLMEQLQLCLRLGEHPRCIVTTTPRPLPLFQKWFTQDNVVVTRGTTFENKDNLSPLFMEQVVKEFEGTTLGSQELYGEILTETKGALWQRNNIIYSDLPYDEHQKLLLKRIVVAIDPATTHHEGSDETGIVVVGIDEKGQGYVLEDLSGRHSPLEWGQRAVKAYHAYHADRIVAETNKGGDLVERVIRSIDPHVAYKEVRATRGKATRAEPIAALYEKGIVFHKRPFHALEDQMCSYVPGSTRKSPDRIDALVWGFTEIFLEREATATLKMWRV